MLEFNAKAQRGQAAAKADTAQWQGLTWAANELF
jgi:hypothetical protein